MRTALGFGEALSRSALENPFDSAPRDADGALIRLHRGSVVSSPSRRPSTSRNNNKKAFAMKPGKQLADWFHERSIWT